MYLMEGSGSSLVMNQHMLGTDIEEVTHIVQVSFLRNFVQSFISLLFRP